MPDIYSLSEEIQTDILTCCDGMLEGKISPAELDRLKTLLCQIVVDKVIAPH